MNRLQGLDSPEQYLVTLNARDRIDPAKVIAVMDYEHPIYDLAAIEAQAPAGLAVDTARPPSPAPTTAGASTRTVAARVSRPPAASGWPGDDRRR